jgi:hypothetical protein
MGPGPGSVSSPWGGQAGHGPGLGPWKMYVFGIYVCMNVYVYICLDTFAAGLLFAAAGIWHDLTYFLLLVAIRRKGLPYCPGAAK